MYFGIKSNSVTKRAAESLIKKSNFPTIRTHDTIHYLIKKGLYSYTYLLKDFDNNFYTKKLLGYTDFEVLGEFFKNSNQIKDYIDTAKAMNIYNDGIKNLVYQLTTKFNINDCDIRFVKDINGDIYFSAAEYDKAYGDSESYIAHYEYEWDGLSSSNGGTIDFPEDVQFNNFKSNSRIISFLKTNGWGNTLLLQNNFICKKIIFDIYTNLD